MRATLVPAIALLLGACGANVIDAPDLGTDACNEAAAHMSDCLGQDVRLEAECDPQLARQVMSQSCEQIQAGSGEKADEGSPNPWCRMFPSTCHTICDEAQVYYVNCGVGIGSVDVPCDVRQARAARLVMATDCATLCGVGRTNPCPPPAIEIRQALCDVGFEVVCLGLSR